MFRTLKDRVIGIYDENRIKIAHYDQRKYDSSKPSDNKDKSVTGLVKTSDSDGGKIMRPHVLEFGHDIGVDDMVSNDQFVYRRKSADNGDLIVGQTLKNKMIW